jgi:hypothetical protein
MRFNCQYVVLTVASTLAMSIVCLSGCRSGMPQFSGIKSPDMSKLAFWKAQDEEKVPPPPAHHFAPAPLGEEKVAENSKSSDIQVQFNKIAEAAREQKDKLAREGGSVSKPYKLPDPRAAFQKAATSEKSDIDAKAESAESTIEIAQREFNAAIANSRKGIEDSVAKSSRTVTEASNTWKKDLQLPGQIAKVQNDFSAAQNEFNASMAKVNNSIFDSAKGITQNAKQMAGDTLKKTLEPNLSAISQSTSSMLESSVAAAQNSADKIKAKGLNEFESAQAQVQAAQQQIADLKEQIAAAKVKSDEMIVDKTKQATEYAAAAITKPIDRMAQLDLPLAKTPADNTRISPIASGGSNEFSSGNRLRSGGNFAPSEDRNQSQPQSQASYPSTPHDSFTPRKMSQNDFGGSTPSAGMLTPKESASNGNFSPLDKHVVNASTTNESGIKVSPATHVSEVDIPQNVLTGKSSYAPGSVNALQPIK